MPTICFKAFSFLQTELKKRGWPCFNDQMSIRDNQTVKELISELGLDTDQVEAAFVNGRVSPFTTTLKDGDRLALVPPGTPGPYRVILGIRDGHDGQGSKRG